MNPDTLNLIERPYQEVVDDILTAMVGGVVNEPIFFDKKSERYPLSQPASDVRGITGKIEQEVDGELKIFSHSFQKNIDFIYEPDENVIVWQEGAKAPVDESVFFADYFIPDANSPLTDINVGSVTRTLSEAIGREIATVYQQINLAYLNGFIDTATGVSLDQVVAILNVKRKTADFAVGLVTFFRDPQSSGNITISSGTLLSTTKGDTTFETTQLRTLQTGQARIDVPVRATNDFRKEAGQVDSASITQVAQTIEGIARITNFEATFLAAQDETDAELRLRAKAALRALGKATHAALAQVIFAGRGNLLEIWDPNGPELKRSEPGTTVLLIEAEPERFPSLQTEVHNTRAAGIDVSLVARYVFFTPKIVAQISAGITNQGKEKIKQQIIANLQLYVDELSSGDPAKGAALLDAIKATDDVKSANIVDVISWVSNVTQPGTSKLVDRIVDLVAITPSSDVQALKQGIESIVSEDGPIVPGTQRIPDRSRLQSTLEPRNATDGEILGGEFEIVAVIDGENWWVSLDIDAADILLQENGS
ncbi:hypothetical protein [Paraglaciecola sp. MB-3u-78]|uniref:hypothetical protein n=1 Tax=Paraglaciecola sp. MB-3u-78 TaxID=2058332 RepID=UPI000C345741|nr:hypothetical protein [Paraglaciecola sp. MB-3u-78]PKH00464.1 hypothetical protein CXF95_02690 [Paraglaciecola sp. MB-3u-78]